MKPLSQHLKTQNYGTITLMQFGKITHKHFIQWKNFIKGDKKGEWGNCTICTLAEEKIQMCESKCRVVISRQKKRVAGVIEAQWKCYRHSILLACIGNPSWREMHQRKVLILQNLGKTKRGTKIYMKADNHHANVSRIFIFLNKQDKNMHIIWITRWHSKHVQWNTFT